MKGNVTALRKMMTCVICIFYASSCKKSNASSKRAGECLNNYRIDVRVSYGGVSVGEITSNFKESSLDVHEQPKKMNEHMD